SRSDRGRRDGHTAFARSRSRRTRQHNLVGAHSNAAHNQGFAHTRWSGDFVGNSCRGTRCDDDGSPGERLDHPTRRHGGRLVERADRAPVATFFSVDSFSVGATIALSDEAAHHIRVARVGVGECIALRDGAGRGAVGVLVKSTKSAALVDVSEIAELPKAAPIHLLAPVADRERMLWLAEKVTELGVSSWRPVIWRRSKSVTPRGEGPTFQAKVRARMIAALIQSGAGWLPDIFPEATVDRAV